MSLADTKCCSKGFKRHLALCLLQLLYQCLACAVHVSPPYMVDNCRRFFVRQSISYPVDICLQFFKRIVAKSHRVMMKDARMRIVAKAGEYCHFCHHFAKKNIEKMNREGES